MGDTYEYPEIGISAGAGAMTVSATAERRFRVMGSDAHVIVAGGGAGTALVDRARRRLDDLEAMWSRFRPDSEVVELTTRAGQWVNVSPETALLVRRAVEAWGISGASFDPTVLGDMIRAGYDRSFDVFDDRPRSGLSALLHGCGEIEVDGNRVRLPGGTGFDPGGIGKGLAADLVTAELIEAGAVGACVNVGGDLRVRGDGPTAEADGWTVGVDHPWLDAPLALVGLRDGAVASSTTLKRQWEVDGEHRHHLIDPGTGRPSTSDLTFVSVITTEGWRAEILAKAVLLRGSAHPFDLLGGTGAEALCIDATGRLQATDGFTAFTGGVPLPLQVEAAPPPD